MHSTFGFTPQSNFVVFVLNITIPFMWRHPFGKKGQFWGPQKFRFFSFSLCFNTPIFIPLSKQASEVVTICLHCPRILLFWTRSLAWHFNTGVARGYFDRSVKMKRSTNRHHIGFCCDSCFPWFHWKHQFSSVFMLPYFFVHCTNVWTT